MAVRISRQWPHAPSVDAQTEGPAATLIVLTSRSATPLTSVAQTGAGTAPPGSPIRSDSFLRACRRLAGSLAVAAFVATACSAPDVAVSPAPTPVSSIRSGAPRPLSNRPPTRATMLPFASPRARAPTPAIDSSGAPCPAPIADLVVCTEPFRVAWRYTLPDVRGFRVQLLYPISQTLLSFIASSDERIFAFPVDAWPEREPGDTRCLERWIGIVVVDALHEMEQPRLGSATVRTICATGDPEGMTVATPDPRLRS
jgi:hypothetical protein